MLQSRRLAIRLSKHGWSGSLSLSCDTRIRPGSPHFQHYNTFHRKQMTTRSDVSFLSLRDCGGWIHRLQGTTISALCHRRLARSHADCIPAAFVTLLLWRLGIPLTASLPAEYSGQSVMTSYCRCRLALLTLRLVAPRSHIHSISTQTRGENPAKSM